MRPLKFLTTGKSLIGLRDQARYEMRQANLLPRFESTKNPFAHTTVPAGCSAQPRSNPVSEKSAEVKLSCGNRPAAVRLETASLFEAAMPVAPAFELEPLPLPPEPQPAVAAPVVAAAAPIAIVPASPRLDDKPSAAAAMPKLAAPVIVPREKFSFEKTINGCVERLANFFSSLKNLRRVGDKVNMFSLKAPTKNVKARLARTAEQPELSLSNLKVVRNDLNDVDLHVVGSKSAKTPGAPLSLIAERWQKTGQTQLH